MARYLKQIHFIYKQKEVSLLKYHKNIQIHIKYIHISLIKREMVFYILLPINLIKNDNFRKMKKFVLFNIFQYLFNELFKFNLLYFSIQILNLLIQSYKQRRLVHFYLHIFTVTLYANIKLYKNKITQKYLSQTFLFQIN